MAIHSPGGVMMDQLMALVPAPAEATPLATALDSKKGGSPRFALEDHTHATRVQRTVVVTAADGTATWTFARPIVCASGKIPPVTYMAEDTGTPVVVQIIARAFTTDAVAGVDTHASVTIRAQRARTLPATILTLAGLINFDIFGAAVGQTKVNLVAADPTQ